MEEEAAHQILTELREFREENNKKWEQNDKRWEQNEKRWIENEKRWKDNDRQLKDIDNRIIIVEHKRSKDRNELMDIFERFEKSITSQFNYMQKYIDTKYDRIYEMQLECQKEYINLKRRIDIEDTRLEFQNERIKILEKWKNDNDDNFIVAN